MMITSNNSNNAIEILFRHDRKKNNKLNATKEHLVGHVP